MRRTLLAITAVLLATIGTTLLYVYVSTADNRAKAQIERVSVLVATGNAASGTPAAQVPAKRQDVAIFDKMDGALGRIDSVQGLVLTTKVLAGQQLTAAMFDKPTVGGLPSGHQAVSVQFAEAPRVASLTKAGSLVDIFKLAGSAKPVLRKATVLSVGAGGIVTFDLSPSDAQTLLDTIAGGGQLVLVYTGQGS
jgi:pilus assembly protein CpaB